jgi:hypothetical protein
LDAFLSLITKIVGVTAPVGAVLFLTALSVYVGRREGIEFLITMDPTIFLFIMVAGIIGLWIVFVAAVRGIWLVIETLMPVYIERRTTKRTALKNMAVGALPREYADTLRFLKTNNQKRFFASNHNQMLQRMKWAFLLEIDDSNWSLYSAHTYYTVPDYVWREIDHGWLKNHPVPSSEPWMFPR